VALFAMIEQAIVNLTVQRRSLTMATGSLKAQTSLQKVGLFDTS
jgi:hypothetical protein